MPDFVHPSLLTIGLPLIAVPILIHLINKVRQRRVRWAAMEFLLQSQRRNRTWVLLTQLLLLLLRMGAVAAVVLMVAQPVLR
ncbi:MAG TPA: BatA domain-containing protein, partial [Burkholderiaceae bacterium]|nr:BatA domain-containing protein [Burkholderiaceae bacterium]